MANISMGYVIGIAVTLIIIGFILPYGLGYLSDMGAFNFTSFEYGNVNDTTVTKTLTDVIDPTVLQLLTTLIPIGVAISLLAYFIPKNI